MFPTCPFVRLLPNCEHDNCEDNSPVDEIGERYQKILITAWTTPISPQYPRNVLLTQIKTYDIAKLTAELKSDNTPCPHKKGATDFFQNNFYK